MTHSIARWAAAVAAVIVLTGAVRTQAQVLADSRAQFSGTQGQDGWRYGYRSYTIEGSGEDNYDPVFSFIEFAGGAGFGDWDGFNQIWNEAGQAWDANTEPAGPWTVIGEEVVHPNGENNFPYDEQWVIRRWVAEGVGPNTFVQITWNTRKQNTGGGDGVTGGIWINGEKISAASIAGNDGVGVTRTNYARISNGDAVDLVLTPVGPNGDRSDGFDGSYHWMILEIPADTDGDGLPDAWELLYAADLTSLTGTGDFDSDGVTDADELPRGTNPTLADTDGDGLPDGVETNTGTFVSATNTGTDPLNPDTDGDGRLDGDEVNGDIKTDVFNPDSDGDSFSDGIEVAAGHDPNDFGDTLVSSLIANSAEEFSGVQGQDGWFYGYRDATADGGAQDYDAVADFIPFAGGDTGDAWDGTTQTWTGSKWDLNTSGAPWDEIGRENSHPNGPGPVHWVIRRWEATELTDVTPLALRYHVRKSNLSCGNGVTAGIHINGRRMDAVTIPFNDATGVVRTYYANVAPTDKIDLILSPRGTDDSDADGCDGSALYLHIDPVLPAVARQPNGDLFVPAGSGDTDGDGLPDLWEELYFPGDLTQLSATGDKDNDGLSDLEEYQRDSDPTRADTDGDGLPDVVETKTGIFVSATDTGTDPRLVDSDSDTLSDYDEVYGQPATDPNKADTDGDGFMDAAELEVGTDPNDPADNMYTYVIANSITEFSGVQGSNGWRHGYRNFTLDGGGINYDPETQFIPYVGGEGMGPWDGVNQQWTGNAWDLETAGTGPWTYLGSTSVHPNGTNSFPFEEHWAIRRWIADEVTNGTPVTIIWQIQKSNPSGGGVGGALFINGILVDSEVIPGDGTSTQARRYSTTLQKGDIVDLAITPENADGTRDDGSDGSTLWFLVDTRPQTQALRIVDSAFNATTGQFTLTWESQAGATYAVEASSDLGTWTEIASGVASGGTRTTYSDTPGAGISARYYRVSRE